MFSRMLKHVSMVGLLAMAASGCAPAPGPDEVGFTDDEFSVDVKEGDAKADGDDIYRLFAKYENPRAGNYAFSYLNLKSNQTWVGVLKSADNGGLGVTVSGMYRAMDSYISADDAKNRYLIFTLNFDSANAPTEFKGQKRSYQVAMSKQDRGQADAIQFKWIRSFNPDTGAATFGVDQAMSSCTACSLVDFDPIAHNDDNTFKVKVESIAVNKVKSGDETDIYAEKWDDNNGAAGKPDLQICMGGACTDVAYDLTEATATNFTRAMYVTGASLRNGIALSVKDYDSWSLSDDSIGATRAKFAPADLDAPHAYDIPAFGKVKSLRISIEKMP